MLSPRYLEGAADTLVDIYSQLETDILRDMARRIAKLGKVTDATDYQSRILAEAGGLKQNIAKILKGYDKKIIKAVQETYTEALKKNTANDNRIFKAATGRTVSDQSAQQTLATVQNAHNNLSRLTRTTAATSQQQFVQQANRVFMEVQSGAFDYESATRHAVNDMAARGITTVQYQNGKPVTRTIEAAVRMNVLTSINNTAATVTMSNCEDLGCDLVEVSAHIGARNRDGPNPWSNHEAWQGKIYKLNGSTDKYPNFYDTCGYGEADGICGINCRHSFYPYFEGSEARYSDNELDDMKDKDVEYNGQRMSQYEAEQRQRGIERNIRKYKRLAESEKAANLDNTRARQKIGEWQARARDFSRQTGLEREYTREHIGTSGGKQPMKTTPKTELTRAHAENMFPDEKWNERGKNIFVAENRESLAKRNSTEKDKFERELSQAKLLRNSGHVVYLPAETGSGKHYDFIMDGVPTEAKQVQGNINTLGTQFKRALKQGHNIFIQTKDKTVKDIYSKFIGETNTLIKNKTELNADTEIYVWIDNKMYTWKLKEFIDIAKRIP
ncbi:phage minor capsid protein 2 [Treponema socranskii subsp. socranskii VPI DR56BR1116 = ATCC 35536]|uniref:Phage minor capsid protein 2 n=1 Tax=Treponema socranskii subsp. socranskii VPI DR56BR1116 = ATCC 35536 TaxID=1125725 RepID=U1GZ24_TRESO|nr:phage minor capsid protein [Treponema socranskii]ERF61799.1 phage minor capsid protein 2 [Treponema socranskii subsp. socranskii VPI DR56BR1116 = ATCC 35536]ERK05113.1 phage minor capsid protein 2 [Treponema socranskii subsp. socranskii VPI DR56BR1116 = ATCC 35536]